MSLRSTALRKTC